jgi:hypothetical protein
VHPNGVGQSFYDCNALDTFTEPSALEACNAYAATQAAMSGYGCTNVWSCTGHSPFFVCYGNETTGDCPGPCWSYSGTYIGDVDITCQCYNNQFIDDASWE